MVIKRSPGGEFAGGGRSTWKSTCEVPGWLHLAIDQHPVCPNLAPAWTLTSEFDRINWPLTSEMYTFWICTRVLQWSCLKAVSVSTFVLGGLRGFTATSDLVIGSAEALPILCVRCAWWERERERETRKWRHLSSAEIGEEVCTFPCQNAEIGEEFCTFPCQKFAP